MFLGLLQALLWLPLLHLLLVMLQRLLDGRARQRLHPTSRILRHTTRHLPCTAVLLGHHLHGLPHVTERRSSYLRCHSRIPIWHTWWLALRYIAILCCSVNSPLHRIVGSRRLLRLLSLCLPLLIVHLLLLLHTKQVLLPQLLLLLLEVELLLLLHSELLLL